MRLEGFAADDLQRAPGLGNDPIRLERGERLGHACTANAQHRGQQIMGHRQLVSGDPVVCQQQPARQALVDVVLGIAQRDLRLLVHQQLHIAQQVIPDRRILRHDRLQVACRYAERQPWNLHDGAMQGDHRAENDGEADEAEASDQRDLDRTVSLRSRDARDYTAFHEVDRVDRLVGFMNDRVPFQLHGPQERPQLLEVRRRQRRKKMILHDSGLGRRVSRAILDL